MYIKGKEIEIPAQPARTVVEVIPQYTHNVGMFVDFTVVHGYPVNNPTTIDQNTSRYILFDDMKYQALMSANPSWAPLKPANTFRVEDLFALLEYIDSGNFDADHLPTPTEE